MRFKVKKDKWITFTFYSSVLVFPIIGYYLETSEDKLMMFGVMAIMGLIMIPLIAVTYYEFREDHLFIRMGYIHTRIKYEKVKSVEAKDRWGKNSSFALSKERVEITVHGKSKIMGMTAISPEKRERFVVEMKRRCPNLEEKRDF